MRYLLTIILATLLIGCGSDSSGGGTGTSNNTGSNQTVNITGSWDYRYITQNSVCDGLQPTGTLTIIASGDVEVATEFDGLTFEVDNFSNCSLVYDYDYSTEDAGDPVIYTANELLAYFRSDFEGDGTIANISLDAFNDDFVQVTVTYNNTVAITLILTR